MPRTKPLGVRLDGPVKDALDRAACEDQRSVTNLVEMVLARYLETRGYLERRPHTIPQPNFDWVLTEAPRA